MNPDWLKQALLLHKRGAFAEALAACAQAPQDPQSQVLAFSLRATALAKLGRRREALHEIDAAVQRGARSSDLCRLGAEICAAQGEPEAALDWIDRALKAGPATRRVLQLRGTIVASMPGLAGMYEHQELVVQLLPQWLEAREHLIQFCFRLHLYSVAARHLEVALAQHPRRVSLHIDKARVCLASGSTQAALDVLERTLDFDVDLADRMRIASLFIKAGALDRAVRLADANLALAPEVAEVHVQRGFFALWQGDTAAAQAACRGLPEPSAGLARLRAAIAFVEERHEAAVVLATQAVEHDSRDSEAYVLRGAALLRVQRYDEAQQSVRMVAPITPEWFPAASLVELAARAARPPEIRHHEVAELFDLLAPLLSHRAVVADDNGNVPPGLILDTIDLGLRRLRGNFSATLTYVPESSSTWAAFSPKLPARVACVRVADFIHAYPMPQVAEQLGKLAAVYPGKPFVHTHSAELWLWYGDYAACEVECRRAIALAKNDAGVPKGLALTKVEAARWAWVGLGAALTFQGRHGEALEVFAESEAWMRPGAPLLAYRGETLRRCGRIEAARADLTQSLALSPTRISAWVNLGLIAWAQDRHEEAHDIYARLAAQVPQLLRDVERDMQVQSTAPVPDTTRLAATFEHVLHTMRGNRSSARITYFLRDGVARVLSGVVLTPTSHAEPALPQKSNEETDHRRTDNRL